MKISMDMKISMFFSVFLSLTSFNSFFFCVQFVHIPIVCIHFFFRVCNLCIFRVNVNNATIISHGCDAQNSPWPQNSCDVIVANQWNSFILIKNICWSGQPDVKFFYFFLKFRCDLFLLQIYLHSALFHVSYFVPIKYVVFGFFSVYRFA